MRALDLASYRRRLGAVLSVGVASVMASCNGTPSSGASGGGGVAEESRAPSRFVSFRGPVLTLDAVERPTAPHVAVGSTLSADLLTSSDPGIVSIDSAGNLVGHRNGTAIVRSQSGSSLTVTVDAVASLRLVPEHLELRGGEHAVVHAWAEDHEVATRALHWETTNPNIAVIAAATVYAGYTPGDATLTARSGSATATLAVSVRPAAFTLRVRALGSSLKRGEIGRVAVEAPAGLPIEWSSSNSKVLEPLRDGTYYARSRGTADACAAGGGQTSCARIRVR